MSASYVEGRTRWSQMVAEAEGAEERGASDLLRRLMERASHAPPVPGIAHVTLMYGASGVD